MTQGTNQSVVQQNCVTIWQFCLIYKKENCQCMSMKLAKSQNMTTNESDRLFLDFSVNIPNKTKMTLNRKTVQL